MVSVVRRSSPSPSYTPFSSICFFPSSEFYFCFFPPRKRMSQDLMFFILFPCSLVSLSPCLLVSLSPCLLVSLSPCLLVSLSPCLLVPLFSFILALFVDFRPLSPS
eukprot:TRINITY_DN2084_c0_g1_i2.p1 TRINITY_DN2084_c0_g1~~TRINITY_DN2084_c0_g1_i2.p1  ORF type:complete len:106 (+),score=23.38 TRINITY_DN2084_c0_g1_i2:1157-1474(+)